MARRASRTVRGVGASVCVSIVAPTGSGGDGGGGGGGASCARCSGLSEASYQRLSIEVLALAWPRTSSATTSDEREAPRRSTASGPSPQSTTSAAPPRRARLPHTAKAEQRRYEQYEQSHAGSDATPEQLSSRCSGFVRRQFATSHGAGWGATAPEPPPKPPGPPRS